MYEYEIKDFKDDILEFIKDDIVILALSRYRRLKDKFLLDIAPFTLKLYKNLKGQNETEIKLKAKLKNEIIPRINKLNKEKDKWEEKIKNSPIYKELRASQIALNGKTHAKEYSLIRFLKAHNFKFDDKFVEKSKGILIIKFPGNAQSYTTHIFFKNGKVMDKKMYEYNNVEFIYDEDGHSSQIYDDKQNIKDANEFLKTNKI